MSQAAKTTEKPFPFSKWVSLAIEVVFPAPFIPKNVMMKGPLSVFFLVLILSIKLNLSTDKISVSVVFRTS